ncbi:MAG TPA: GH32 C-terminal domain-containing protein [Bacilli bacterium]|nr:GH32 C-terminal domain-containing protein [Bacilli bacterium]
MKYTTLFADAYIEAKRHQTVPKYRPKFHLTPPIGWMNDPNGFVYYQGAFHVFYQFHPYDSRWGPMHWGHASSYDLITFKHLPVALAPDMKEEHGCFSGGAIVDPHDPKRLYLTYTMHYENGEIRQRQNIATSIDGLKFIKKDVPILTELDLPTTASISEFRDPKPLYIDGHFYLLVGSSSNGVGQILVYRSQDLVKFDYHFTIGPNRYFGVMAECPDLARISNHDVLIVSSTKLKSDQGKFQNINSSLAFIGTFDLANRKYQIDAIQEIDRGHAFYAPQLTQAPNQDIIMTAWMNMWDKPNFTDIEQHGWSGSLILPRVLSIKNGLIYQRPIASIDKYIKNELAPLNNAIVPKTGIWFVKMDQRAFWEWRFENIDNPSDYISISTHDGFVIVDASNVVDYPLEARKSLYRYSNDVELRLIIDTSSFELFIEDGRETITTLAYLNCDSYRLCFIGDQLLIMSHKFASLDINNPEVNDEKNRANNDNIVHI